MIQKKDGKRHKNKILSGIKKIESLNKILKSSRRPSPTKKSPEQDPKEIEKMELKSFNYYRDILNTTDRKNHQLFIQRSTAKDLSKQLIQQFKKKNQQLQIQLQKKQQEIQELNSQKLFLSRETSKLRTVLEQISTAIEPFTNNISLMQIQLLKIKEIIQSANIKPQEKRSQNELSMRNSFNIELHALQKTRKFQHQQYQNKFYRLNVTLTQSFNKNTDLEKRLTQYERQIQILKGIINQGEYANQQRQLYLMAHSQFQAYKQMYERQKIYTKQLKKIIQKQRNKITMLTSLIGYGVVTPMKSNDLYDIQLFKQNLVKKDSLHRKLSNDVYGLSQLAIAPTFRDIAMIAMQNDKKKFKTIYLPNFLLFYDEQLFSDHEEEQSKITVIKPQFFLFLRAILDAKYRDFMLEGGKSSRFPQFVHSFIHKFYVPMHQKNIILNNRTVSQDKDLVKASFLLKLFDDKIKNLPEIKTFKEFLMENDSQDQLFYYLMCRNVLMNGPELKNYINCSDSYNFMRYDHVQRCLTHILEPYDKSTKEIIITNLSSKKVTKNNINFIKSGYVLRLLLEVYRKDKRDKISKLSILFSNVNEVSNSNVIRFTYFCEILLKNFSFLTLTQICHFYRQTVSVYQTDPNINLFEAFYAACSQELFLSSGIKFDLSLKTKVFKHLSQSLSCNYLMELIPDSISQIGCVPLYQEYAEMIKIKELTWLERKRIAELLLRVTDSKILKRSKPTEVGAFEKLMDNFNNALIDWLNNNLKEQRDYEEQINRASKKIGRKMKVKIYQFYQEFINDIKKQLLQ